MANLTSVVSATGAGSQLFAGGIHSVTDIDLGVKAVGVQAHIVSTGAVDKVLHVGWIGVGYNHPAHAAYVDSPTKQLTWWAWVEFMWEDKFVSSGGAITADCVIWNLTPGCTVEINVSG